MIEKRIVQLCTRKVSQKKKKKKVCKKRKGFYNSLKSLILFLFKVMYA